jgi:uncharacterized membrane protein
LARIWARPGDRLSSTPAREPTVAHALLRLLGSCAAVAGDDPERRAAIEEQARIVVADAEREVAQPVDLALAHGEAEAVRQVVTGNRPYQARRSAGRTSRGSRHHRDDRRGQRRGSRG